MLRAGPASLTDFFSLFDQISSIGSSPNAGVTRLAASAEDGQARQIFARWMIDHGARIATDAIGNQFACFDWAGADAPWVFAGSHLDTQPRGGRYDGTLGVVSASVAASEIQQAVETGQIRPARNLAIVNWTNEEGARFQPSLTGSGVYAGTLSLETALALQDGTGTCLDDALAAIGVVGVTGNVPPHPDTYLEIHVEQGRKLVEAGAHIGVVTGTWAARKITVRWIGRAAHTGPTVMADRLDALLGAARGIAAFEDAMAARYPHLHRSAARLVVEPNSPNVVVNRATVWFELRGLEVEELSLAGEDALLAFATAAAQSGTRLEIVSDALREPAHMNADLAEFVADTARRQGFAPLPVHSVAGHDAVALQNSGIPSALIFIPSVDGIAHHPDEFTEPQDVQAGLTVLAGVLKRLVEGESYAI